MLCMLCVDLEASVSWKYRFELLVFSSILDIFSLPKPLPLVVDGGDANGAAEIAAGVVVVVGAAGSVVGESFVVVVVGSVVAVESAGAVETVDVAGERDGAAEDAAVVAVVVACIFVAGVVVVGIVVELFEYAAYIGVDVG